MQARFEALDGMRGVAAIAVVPLHAAMFFGGPPLPSAFLAVDFFFALSGFVLAHAYDEKLRGSLSPMAFMRDRLIRLYPLYILGTIIGLMATIAFSLIGADRDVDVTSYVVTIVTAGLFLPSPMPLKPDIAFPLLYPAWSLFYELVANLVFAFASPLLTNRVLRALIPTLAIVFAVSTAIVGDLGGPTWSTFGGGFARVLFGFFTGVAVYRLFVAHPIRSSVPLWLVVVVLLGLMRLTLTAYQQLAICVFVIPVLLYLGACSRIGPRTAAVCGVLGASSYALYALHFPMLNIVDRGLTFVGLDAVRTSAVAGLILIVGFVGIAILAERYYDRPVRALLRARLAARRARTVEQPKPAGD